MEIKPDEISGIVNDQKTGKVKKSTGDKFGDILQQAIEKSSSSVDQASKLQQVQNISNIRFDLIQGLDKTQNIERMEKFLDVIEDYQKKLGDPSVSLKEISPVCNKMESEAENMLSLLNSLPDGDEIKGILNKALVTSTVEAIKFNRGDYL